jgi:enoyl-[acyl-carrier protein] reductase II
LGILGGAMTWVSESTFVSAISNTGGFGVLACGAMPPENLRAEICATRTKTLHPFGVNLILLHPQLEALLEVCIDEKVTHVVFAGGLPSKSHIERLKAHDIRVVAFAPALSLGKKLVRSGVDALIIEGSEAGGHVGMVSTSVLAQEILPEIKEVPIFIAGGIGRGSMVAQYLQMGASGVQLGTLLVCAEESLVHSRFKEAFVRASARDAVLSPQLDARFPVIPVRALSNAGMQGFVDKQREVIQRFDQGVITQKEGQLEVEHFWAGALRRAVVEGDVETGSLMAGQSVGLVKDIKPLAAIFHDLLNEALGHF